MHTAYALLTMARFGPLLVAKDLSVATEVPPSARTHPETPQSDVCIVLVERVGATESHAKQAVLQAIMANPGLYTAYSIYNGILGGVVRAGLLTWLQANQERLLQRWTC